jgi:glycosyltransferase involved in cell wall biosynthesis
MCAVSIVIITHNEQDNIADCIRSVKPLTDDIIVIDAGSDDDTIEIANREGARSFSVTWQGYGWSRNFGAAQAKNDWILALDADERLSPELIASLSGITICNPEIAYRFRRKNFIGPTEVRFGTMAHDKVTRLYNRNYSSWDFSIVHEKLLSKSARSVKINGHVLHFAFDDLKDYHAKAIQYAEMSAEKYFAEGKKAGVIKRFLSPVFNSLKSYILYCGFLQGKQGFSIAKTIWHYTWLKYDLLNKMNRRSQPSFASPK